MNMFVKTVRINSKSFVRSVRRMMLLHAPAAAVYIPIVPSPNASAKVTELQTAVLRMEAVIVVPAETVRTAVIRTGKHNG